MCTVFCVIGLSACSDKLPSEYIEDAKALVEQGNRDAAIIELKNAISENPQFAPARFELGKIYIANNNFESAGKELSRALELGYSKTEVIPLLTLAYQRIGANVALSDLEIDSDAYSPEQLLEINFRKLQSYIVLAEKSKAIQIVNDADKIESDSIYKDLISAHRHIIYEDAAKALEEAVKVYEKAPTNRDVLSFAARLYRINDEKEKAAQIYEQYSEVAPDDIETKFLLAELLVELGQMDKAEVIVDELMEINDQNAFLNQLKGTIRSANEDYASGLEYSEKALRFGRSDPKLRLIAGFSAYRLDNFEKAALHFSAVESVLADGHPGIRFLVVSYLKNDQTTQAIELLPRVGDLTDQDSGLLSRAILGLLTQGKIDDAKAMIEQAESLTTSTDDLIRLGILQLSANDTQSIENLEKARAQSPESLAANAVLGAAYIDSREFEKALALADEWMQQAPNTIDPYLLKVETLQRQHNFADAKVVIDEADKLFADDMRLLIAKLRYFSRQNDQENALAVNKKILQQDPTNVVGLAGYFHIASQQGNVEDGINKVKKAFEENPDNSEIALLLGRISLLVKDSELSLKALNKFSADKTAPAEFWPLKGSALTMANQTDNAMKHYETWLSLAPTNESAAVGILNILNQRRDFTKGAELADSFLANNESDRVSAMLAHFSVHLGDIDKAKRLLKGLSDQMSNSPFVKSIVARIYYFEGKFDKAFVAAKQAYEGNKTSEGLLLYVQTMDRIGKAGDVADLMVNHLQEFPNDIGIKILYAGRLTRIDHKQAISTYKEVLSDVPDNYLVLNNLAFLLMKDDKLDEAETYAKRVYELQPKNVGVVDTYAQILAAQGELDEALELYGSVMNSQVDNEDIIINHIELLLKNGSIAIAKRRLAERDFRSPLSIVRIRDLREEYSLGE